jgi:hypothetical protein
MMMKDGKYHIVLTVFYRVYGDKSEKKPIIQQTQQIPLTPQFIPVHVVDKGEYKQIRSKPHMHKTSYEEMKKNISSVFEKLPKESIIIDFGSQDVNGSYKPLIDGRWKYVGVDLGAGPNVDVKMKSVYDSGLPDGYADGLICGQTLEHCRNPFLLAKEMMRIVKKGAFLLVTAPAVWPEHKFPFDCWRFYPDGMISLFDSVGGHTWKSYLVASDEFVMDKINNKPILQGKDCWWLGEKK